MKKIFLIIIASLFLLYLIYLANQNIYYNRFEKTKANSHMKSIIKEWGKPSEIFDYDKDELVFFYHRDWLGWERYAFVFSKKDSLLVRKSIDD